MITILLLLLVAMLAVTRSAPINLVGMLYFDSEDYVEESEDSSVNDNDEIDVSNKGPKKEPIKPASKNENLDELEAIAKASDPVSRASAQSIYDEIRGKKNG